MMEVTRRDPVPVPSLSDADRAGPPFVVCWPDFMGFHDVRFLGGADGRLTDKLQFAERFADIQGAARAAWHLARQHRVRAVAATLSEACELAGGTV